MHERHSSERRYAEFYRIYCGDFRSDIPIYLDLAAKFQGPVLDIGCGTGRVSAHLAAAGHEVHAIDISRPMLEVAAKHLKPWATHTRVYDFDLRSQPIGEPCPVGFVSLHSFNFLIDVEEQRLFLRHLRQSIQSPGVVALDLFCPLSMMRPDYDGGWRDIKRVFEDHTLRVRDRREMLTPLLERRIQVFKIDEGREAEMVTHRRYVPPTQLASLLVEAGFENVRWTENYDSSTIRPLSDTERPQGPFTLIADA